MDYYKNIKLFQEKFTFRENKGNKYCLILICIDDFYQQTKDLDEEEIELIKFSILNVSLDILKVHESSVLRGFMTIDGAGIFFQIPEEIDSKDLAIDLYNASFKLIDKVQTIINHAFCIGISSFYDKQNDFEKSLDEAQDLLSHHLIEPKKRVYIHLENE